MSRPISISDTLTFTPVSLDTTNSNYPGTYYSTNVLENAFTDASSSTRWAPYTNTGSRAATTIYLNFDCSVIPEGATITSVSCRVKCGTQGTNYFGTRTVQMATGTTVKGSATTMAGSNSSPQTHSLTVGTWTASEIRNAKLKFYVVRGTSNTTTDATFSIFGATLTVSYSYSGTAYSITATSNVSGITVDPSSQEKMGGETATVTINADDLSDYEVTDNGNDISSSLVRHQQPTVGTINAVPDSYTTRGSISGTRYQSTIGCGVDNPSSQTGSDYCSSNGSYATIYYKFDFSSIPANATIDSMTVQARGHLESTSESSERARLNTYSGTTAKGTAVSYTSTSNATLTITPGSWTVSELRDDPRVGFEIGYYGGLTVGITWSVTYSVPGAGGYYYTYTINNVAADHVIVIDEAGVFIPPEEDPNETYWPITISSINATTNPANGTTRVLEGSNQTITITPSDPQLTLALDNGVDITSQLTGGTPTNTYAVTTQVSGASYGFTLNSGTGYYISNNGGQSNSAAVCRVNFTFETACLVTISYINYAEATYDYGIFGQIDTALRTTYSVDSGAYHVCSTRAENTSAVQTLTYNIPAGSHYIDIKYRKDQYTDDNNDDLRWQITNIEPLEAGEYTYTLTNITAKHSLIFVFGNVNFYYITSSTSSGARIFPDGQVVVLEGDSYILKIVPDATNSSVGITDNGINQTSSLQQFTGVDKNNNPIVSYTYSLSNIRAAHTLVVSIGGAVVQLYVKVNNTWRPYSKAYKKINGSWVEQDITNVFSTSANYVKGN